MSKILLTGASGRTGRKVLAALAARGHAVRALIRDERHRAALASLGAAESALGDLDRAESLAAAAAGMEVVVHIGPPMHPNELQQTEAMLAAAQAGGAGHFVYYSVMQPLRREIRHHRLKLEAEEQVVESGLAYTILQPSRYMQHLEPILDEVRSQGVHAMPFAVDRRFSLVDLDDLAEAVAIVAGAPEHFYAIYELGGPEALSMADAAAVLTRALGRPVEARAIPLDELERTARAKGMSEDRIAQMKAMNHHYDRFGLRANPNVLRWLLGREPNRFADYVARLI